MTCQKSCAVEIEKEKFDTGHKDLLDVQDLDCRKGKLPTMNGGFHPQVCSKARGWKRADFSGRL